MQAVQNNGSLFAHIIVSQDGAAYNPSDKNFDPERSFHAAKRMLSKDSNSNISSHQIYAQEEGSPPQETYQVL